MNIKSRWYLKRLFPLPFHTLCNRSILKFCTVSNYASVAQSPASKSYAVLTRSQKYSSLMTRATLLDCGLNQTPRAPARRSVVINWWYMQVHWQMYTANELETFKPCNSACRNSTWRRHLLSDTSTLSRRQCVAHPCWLPISEVCSKRSIRQINWVILD